MSGGVAVAVAARDHGAGPAISAGAALLDLVAARGVAEHLGQHEAVLVELDELPQSPVFFGDRLRVRRAFPGVHPESWSQGVIVVVRRVASVKESAHRSHERVPQHRHRVRA